MNKNAVAACIILMLTSLAFTQENPTNETPEKRDVTKNELSLNAFNVVAFSSLEIIYERVLTANSTIAAEGFVQLKDKNNSSDDFYEKNISLTGKYKHFFSSSYARGFYIDAFGMLSNGDQSVYYYGEGFENREDYNYTDFALGFGLGGKFVSENGFLLDLSTGIGRNLFSENSPELVGQFMVNLGFRF